VNGIFKLSFAAFRRRLKTWQSAVTYCNKLHWTMRFPRWWEFAFWPSGLWRRVGSKMVGKIFAQ
jgi:hypothetical protein